MPRPLLIAVAIAVAAGALVVVVRARTSAPVPVQVIEATPEPTPAPLIVVDVEGAVARPGIVRLASGARVADALAAAGGTTPEADPAALNKAATLRDGARVYVPRYGETPPAGSLGSESERKVDINQASAAELESLPGIGPSTAARIVRAREQRAFTKVDELQTRGLVTARILADIRDLVTTR
ncbi:MAG TPA: ComEA family DNA-binding protein [Candidatus Limnocylindria bacterium]|jgi:competence protein ComEA|nr:ComEA family DNA-binding protein [Candidatus Limnocylindria bacterium]